MSVVFVIVMTTELLRWVGEVADVASIARMLALSAARSMRGGGGARDIGGVLWVVGSRDGVVCGCGGVVVVMTVVVASKS